MEALKLFVFTVLLSLVVAHIGVGADVSISDVDEEVEVPRSEGPDSSILEPLKSKIHSLESHVEEKIREIKDKDEVIAAKERIIKEKSDSIATLENEITSLQKKGKLDAAEQVGKAHSRASELEKEVEILRKDIDLKIKEKALLQARITELETKASELNSKIDSLQKIIGDQKTKIRKTERALQIAEEEMMKAKFEATSKIKELMEIHGAWLPPWLAVHLNKYQSLLEKNWKVHGKPALEMLMQKASVCGACAALSQHMAVEKKAQAEEWAAPHVETIKTKWVPAVKEQWVVITTNVEPHVQTLTTRAVELYEVSKDTVTPHIIKVQEVADPYFQELRRLSKPYIDQVATAAKPHVDKLRSALKPYTQQAVHAYGKFLESATTYHSQVQDVVHEKLNSHELTKHLATKELVWFSASALLALPIIFLLKIFSATFGSNRKPRKPVRNGNAHTSRRKGKRVHSDK
ncbi:DNA repair ATPase-related family protein [Striga asiatica]|uniref:DNA repair ATPase-related family protein n=1 Tax=Striga asiatica TaxID=4170 RepID=A0A5A7Q4H9_STRAF|nr:DNA repair ATPase-related family protein [Striga asiatica]